MGLFRARPEDAGFEDSGPARGHLLVFPGTAVRITHAGRAPVVATASRVMFYNRGAEYRRTAIDPLGDRCTWLSFDPVDLTAALSTYEPAAADRFERPFAWTNAPVRAATVLRQRLLVRSAMSGDDAAAVEEETLALLGDVLVDAFAAFDRGRVVAAALSVKARRARADLAAAAEASLAARFDQPFSLRQLAADLEASPFHLCRVFHRATGRTLHGYLTELRLHRALERVLDGETNLAALAVDLGFATHSHFTRTFRSRFGVAPSQVRKRPVASSTLRRSG